jgi:ATP-dependent helicase/nuclease subunit B
LLALVGEDEAKALRGRGEAYLGWARALDGGPDVPFVPRPCPRPPLEARPRRFSVTDVETLRRDPYAIYARKVLDLRALDPLVRDPGAAERGTLFHAILHRFTEAVPDPSAEDAGERLFDIGRECFDEAGLPDDVRAVWWPRFAAMSGEILAFERGQTEGVMSRHAEAAALATAIGATGATLSGRADRIDVRPGGIADILDYKTGSTPSKRQAHTLVSPQLALEGALMRRGAFTAIGKPRVGELAYVRLRANGEVDLDSILQIRGSVRTGDDLSEDAWSRLEKLVAHYGDPNVGYLSRSLPFREGATDGDYDHLARVLEWSAGGESASGDEGGE